jgi:hypothetical protein
MSKTEFKASCKQGSEIRKLVSQQMAAKQKHMKAGCQSLDNKTEIRQGADSRSKWHEIGVPISR